MLIVFQASSCKISVLLYKHIACAKPTPKALQLFKSSQNGRLVECILWPGQGRRNIKGYREWMLVRRDKLSNRQRVLWGECRGNEKEKSSTPTARQRNLGKTRITAWRAYVIVGSRELRGINGWDEETSRQYCSMGVLIFRLIRRARLMNGDWY